MNIITISLLISGGFILGWFCKSLSSKIIDHIKSKKIISDVTNQFSQVLENIKSNKSLFKSRVNQTVYISTTIKDYGSIDLVYLMDKQDIALFKNNSCIYTSHVVDSKVVNDIISSIRVKFNNQINDVVQVMGITISKSEFEKAFNVNLKDIENQQQSIKLLNDSQKSEIEKIIENNNSKMSMDEILDKIGKVGYDNLTEKEKDFLKKNSN